MSRVPVFFLVALNPYLDLVGEFNCDATPPSDVFIVSDESSGFLIGMGNLTTTVESNGIESSLVAVLSASTMSLNGESALFV